MKSIRTFVAAIVGSTFCVAGAGTQEVDAYANYFLVTMHVTQWVPDPDPDLNGHWEPTGEVWHGLFKVLPQTRYPGSSPVEWLSIDAGSRHLSHQMNDCLRLYWTQTYDPCQDDPMGWFFEQRLPSYIPTNNSLVGEDWAGGSIYWHGPDDEGVRRWSYEDYETYSVDGYYEISTVPPVDSDGDGVPDALDNCSTLPNGPLALDSGGHSQLDADGDGYGNKCDADLNHSGLVTATDFNFLRNCINQPSTVVQCSAADINGSGRVTATDFNLMRARVNAPPGPSGLPCAGKTWGSCWVTPD